MKTIIAATLLSLSTISGAANALEFRVVEDASTETLMVLHATGTVERDDYSNLLNLERILRKAKPEIRIHVILEASGDDIGYGIALAGTFLHLGVSTSVADNAVCTGACAIAWLGGTRDGAPHAHRSPSARIGFTGLKPKDQRDALDAYAAAKEMGSTAEMSFWAVTVNDRERIAYSVASQLILHWQRTNKNFEILARLLGTPHGKMFWLPHDIPAHN